MQIYFMPYRSGGGGFLPPKKKFNRDKYLMIFCSIMFAVGLYCLGYVQGNRKKADLLFDPMIKETFDKGFNSGLNSKIVIKVDSITYNLQKKIK